MPFKSADSALPLTPISFEILLALLQGELHGYAILQAVEGRLTGKLPLRTGTMYRALARLAETGLIAAAARRRAADAGDERRNYYRITDAGIRVARAEVRRLEALMRAARIGGLLGKAAK